MNILITGANGFLGSSLVKYFVNAGDNVFGMIRANADIHRLITVQNQPNYQSVYVSESSSHIFAKNAIDVVIHTATNYGRNDTPLLDVFKANELFPLELLQSSVQHGTKLFVNTDSFFNKEEFSNDHYLEAYKLSKKNFLNWGKLFAKSQSLKFINMRLEHVYGIGDNKSKFVEFVYQSLYNNIKSLDLTLCEQQRDFIHIDDVVSAYEIVVRKNLASENLGFTEYEVGTGKAHSLKFLIETLKNVTGSETILNFGALTYRENEIMYSVADNSKLIELGWRSMHNLKDTILTYYSKS